MASSAPLTPLRRLFEDRLLQISVEAESLFAEARERVRREFADQLNQAVRRMRLAADAEELDATLVDAAGCLAAGAAVFRVEDNAAAGARMRGVSEETSEAFQKLRIPLASAAALAGAAETRDPVIAAGIPSEVSQEMTDLLGHSAESRVSIFPITVRDRTVALLYAWGNPQGPALEILAQLASAILTAVEPAAAPAAGTSAAGAFADRACARAEVLVGQPIRRGAAGTPESPAVRQGSGGGDALI